MITARKKRLLLIAAGVFLCGMVLFVSGVCIQKKNTEEFRKKCKSYEGIWANGDNTFWLEVRRVTSAHMVVSIRKEDSSIDFPFISAVAKDENQYEFQYEPVWTSEEKFQCRYGEMAKGTFVLEDKAIRVDIPEVKNMKGALEFQGVLKKESMCEEEEPVHLMDYMGTTGEMPDSLAGYCSFEKNKEGQVWRIHAVLDQEPGKHYGTELNGINKLCFASDCASAYGRPDDTVELNSGRQKMIFSDNTFKYTVIFNAYGMVSEIDCQYWEVPGIEREGDFLVDGDTVVRYLGDYENNILVKLPEGTKRIAANAFRAEDHDYHTEYVQYLSLIIPADVVIEKEAFAHCGKLHIEFEEGRTVVEEGAFAHMVPCEEAKEKRDWVEITLPKSMKRLEEMAFGLDDSDDGLPDFYSSLDDFKGDPVYIMLNENLEYIGDNALWGVTLSGELPEHMTELGKNLTVKSYSIADFLKIPEGVRVLEKGTIYLRGDRLDYLQIPESLEEIEEGAIAPVTAINDIHIDKNNKHFKTDQYHWLYSKDGRVLYLAFNGVEEFNEEEERFEHGLDETGSSGVRIPDGVEEIRGCALERLSQYEYGFIECVFPRSLKRMNRAVLYQSPQRLRFLGKTPEFYGVLDNTMLQDVLKNGKRIEIRETERKEFLKELQKGQNLSAKNKKLLEKQTYSY